MLLFLHLLTHIICLDLVMKFYFDAGLSCLLLDSLY